MLRQDMGKRQEGGKGDQKIGGLEKKREKQQSWNSECE